MTYTTKELEALAAFDGDIDHLELLRGDIDNFIKEHGEDTTGYSHEQIIELEFRISLYLSFFHICIEYKTRSKFQSGIAKNHPHTKEYLDNFSDDIFSKLQKYRNKTFHENASLSEDMRVKKQLDVKNDFTALDELAVKLIDAWDNDKTESKPI